MFLTTGQFDDAAEHMAEMLRLHDELAKDSNSIQARRDLAIAYQRNASVKLAQNNVPGGVALLRKSLKIRRELLERDPDNHQAVIDVCITLESLGHVEFDNGQSSTALVYYREATKDRLRLQELTGPTIASRQGLANLHKKISATLTQLKEYRQALPIQQAAGQLFRELVEADSDNIEFQIGLISSRGIEGLISDELLDFKHALACFRDVDELANKIVDGGKLQGESRVAMWQQSSKRRILTYQLYVAALSDLDEINTQPEPQRSLLLATRAKLKAREGNLEECKQLIGQTVEPEPPAMEYHYRIARAYGRAAEFAAKTSGESGESLQELSELAVRHLALAIDAGWNKTETLKNHADFQALKTLPAFQRLMSNSDDSEHQ